MKKLLTLVAVLASVSVMANQARMDVSGIKGGNTLKPGTKSEKCHLSNPNWIKDEVKRKQHICFSTPKLKDDWQEVEYTFTPSKDGKLTLTIRGQWHNVKKGQKPNYVYFKEITIEGSALKNGDFSKKNKDGSPSGWWYNRKAKELPVFEEEDGVTIVKVQHNTGMAQNITVKKDQPVKIKAKVKSAMPKK